MYKSDREHRPGRVSISEARETFADLVNRVAYGRERVLIARRDRALAAIVPIEDVERLDRLDRESERQRGRDVGTAQDAAERAEIRRLLSLSDADREAHFLASNRNMLRMFNEEREAR
jgi:prevent-host-death family protein